MKKVLVLTLILLLAFSTVIFAAPGDTSDPIVVLSYLNEQIEALISKYKLEDIDDMQKQIDNLDSSGGSSSGMALEIVEIRNGEKIIAGSGSELILRGGEAVIIGSEMGGISDVTLGKDFVSGMSVVPNHLMIVPRDDGRGVYAEKYAIFMVRGSYKVVK
ncbi:hypothetical protein [Sedimentibacter saalensis]|uniref:Uncharacterized protein n=1 Tax=Sedimentibacter saalensis TaxID=130788 RepID=A0A562JBM6_9FIRM|nr:hypothetical protein [Sedimentibacter saalensis]TWH80483.1 hypothetical protein LY60_01745 [Sedimentibacter saalensis]